MCKGVSNPVKWIMITGGSSGIGESTARYLHGKGYGVFLVARNESKLKKIANELGNNVYYYSYDLVNLNEIEDVFRFSLSKELKLDGLVHCAGINRDVPIRGNSVIDMVDVMSINIMSFIELGKYFYKKKYSNDESTIIAISSLASLYNSIGMCTYSASKAALNSSVQTMSKEFTKRKIRVNAILPSFVNTEMVERTREYVNKLDELVGPLGIIEPIYISYLIEFLISKKAKFITGALIPISSGT